MVASGRCIDIMLLVMVAAGAGTGATGTDTLGIVNGVLFQTDIRRPLWIGGLRRGIEIGTCTIVMDKGYDFSSTSCHIRSKNK